MKQWVSIIKRYAIWRESEQNIPSSYILTVILYISNPAPLYVLSYIQIEQVLDILVKYVDGAAIHLSTTETPKALRVGKKEEEISLASVKECL